MEARRTHPSGSVRELRPHWLRDAPPQPACSCHWFCGGSGWLSLATEVPRAGTCAVRPPAAGGGRSPLRPWLREGGGERPAPGRKQGRTGGRRRRGARPAGTRRAAGGRPRWGQLSGPAAPERRERCGWRQRGRGGPASGDGGAVIMSTTQRKNLASSC
eukprot:XP_025004701.1 nucleoside diphosphate-linked moiety X motif 19-like [Gallus gallus]